MELNYKTSTFDFIEASLLVNWKNPIRYISGIIVLRICIPIFIVIYSSYLIANRPTSEKYLEILLLLLFLVISLFLQKYLLRKSTEKSILKQVLTHPYLIQEKQMIPRDRGVRIIFSSKEIDIDVKYILERNNKFYLYAEKYTIIGITPKNLFKSEEEKQLFLKTVNIPVKPVKNQLLYWGLW